jgi:glycosyltransferase involved in cell wall biosynthesis
MPEDGPGLAKAVVSLAEQPAEERRRMGERGRAFVLADYTRAAQGQRLLALLDGLAGRPR